MSVASDSKLTDETGGTIDPGGLRPILASLPVMLLGFDTRGSCILSEGGLLTNFDLVPGAAVGRPLAESFAQFPHIVSAVQQALAGETLFTRTVAGPDVLDVQWHPRRDDAGEIIGVLVSARIADTDYAAESTFRAEQAYQALLAAIPDQLFRLDRAGRATVVKPATDPDSVELPVSWSPTPLEQLLPAEVASTLSAAANEVMTSATEKLVETQLGALGHERFLETRLIPETDDHVLGIVRDVTQRHHQWDGRQLEQAGRLAHIADPRHRQPDVGSSGDDRRGPQQRQQPR